MYNTWHDLDNVSVDLNKISLDLTNICPILNMIARTKSKLRQDQDTISCES